MKKLLFMTAVATVIAVTSCDSGKLKQAQWQNAVLDNSLQEALANQDSLFSLLNEITEGMDQIKSMEHILSTTPNLSAESTSRREQIRNDMAQIQAALQARRDKLAELEKKLSNSDSYNATLKKTVANLKKEIEEQSGTIESLRNSLSAANIKIEEQDQTIAKLNAVVDTMANVQNETEKALAEKTAQMNTVFYVFGTKKELKEHNIVEGGGFLRKTKIMGSAFDQDYFTAADRRTLKQISLYAKKAKVLTKQPEGSYAIEDDASGQKVLTILDSDQFWRLSDYLVIQTD